MSKAPKIVLKIAPDLDESQLIEMAEVIRKSNIDGVIVSNTTIQRPKTLINSKSVRLPNFQVLKSQSQNRQQTRTRRSIWSTYQTFLIEGTPNPALSPSRLDSPHRMRGHQHRPRRARLRQSRSEHGPALHWLRIRWGRRMQTDQRPVG